MNPGWSDLSAGLNISGERDMVGGGDFDAIIAWMDRRCLTTPSDRIGIAALDLGMELAKEGCPAIAGGEGPDLAARRPARLFALSSACAC